MYAKPDLRVRFFEMDDRWFRLGDRNSLPN